MTRITFISFLIVAVALTPLISASPYQVQPGDKSKHQLSFGEAFGVSETTGTTGPPEELPQCPLWCLTQEECMGCQCGWGRDQRSNTCSCQAGPVGLPNPWCRPKL